MTTAMHVAVAIGLVPLAFVTFRHSTLTVYFFRLPRFLLRGFLWIVCVMFCGLLLSAIAETIAENLQKPAIESLQGGQCTSDTCAIEHR